MFRRQVPPSMVHSQSQPRLRCRTGGWPKRNASLRTRAGSDGELGAVTADLLGRLWKQPLGHGSRGNQRGVKGGPSAESWKPFDQQSWHHVKAMS